MTEPYIEDEIPVVVCNDDADLPNLYSYRLMLHCKASEVIEGKRYYLFFFTPESEMRESGRKYLSYILRDYTDALVRVGEDIMVQFAKFDGKPKNKFKVIDEFNCNLLKERAFRP